MQRNKDTKKIEQIEKVSKNPEQITQSIADVIDKFDTKSIFKETDLIKRSGILVSTITMAMLILPFMGAASVAALFKSGLNKADAGKKDAYYDVKNNEKIAWRLLLLLLAKRFKVLVNRGNEEILKMKNEIEQIKAVIFDDSAIEKTGKTIEGIGYIHDHTSNIHILGYKLLVCGFWDGMSFIPLDFSLHKEKRNRELKKTEERLAKKKEKIKKVETDIQELEERKIVKKRLLIEVEKTYQTKGGKTNEKNIYQKQNVVTRIEKRIEQLKIELELQKAKEQFLANEHFELKSNYRYCGLKKEDYQNQYKKKRDRNSSGYKRMKEANSNKIDNMIKMLKRVVRHGFIPDYVLTDSWFFCQKLLQAIIATGCSIELVSMAKIGTAKYKVLPTDKFLNPNEIITRYNRKQGKNSRKYKARYMQFQAEYQGIRVKIFLIRFGTHGKWRMLVTTEVQMSFTRIMEIYKIRWTIEVFFKECKQYLQLSKCQSQDFDAQIADATLSMIRYILLSYYERTHYGITIGGLFRQLSQAAIKENLLADISTYFIELLQIFAELAGVDFIELYEGLLRKPEVVQIINKTGLIFEKPEISEAA
ncbi:MAG: transposase [candidate division Zixibacteria bacterium]|nr:transposase [candidate division Zixibacteria bacterium]